MREESLFSQDVPQPLASRMRPETLDEFAGQQHLIGKGKVLYNLIEKDCISSMIFWGPPGVGKTTLARIIAHHTKPVFIDFSAVTSGIREIRKVMEEAEKNRMYGQRTIVFVDEIHRFNKAQQDAFPLWKREVLSLSVLRQKIRLLKSTALSFHGAKYLS